MHQAQYHKCLENKFKVFCSDGTKMSETGPQLQRESIELAPEFRILSLDLECKGYKEKWNKKKSVSSSRYSNCVYSKYQEFLSLKVTQQVGITKV